jgi:LysM repeat protein
MDNNNLSTPDPSKDPEKTVFMNNEQKNNDSSKAERTIVEQNSPVNNSHNVSNSNTGIQSNQNPGSNTEKTTIENNSGVASNKNNATTAGAASESQASPKPPLDKLSKEDKGISKTAFAAGVAGAAVAGTALGTAYSDEIKSAFKSDEAPAGTDNNKDASATNAASASTAAQPQENAIPTSASNNDQPHQPETANHTETLNISGTDESGNFYSVSFVDFEGDGKIDFTEAEVTLVDGTTITYSEFGDPLSEAFLASNELASPNDYMQFLNTDDNEGLFSPQFTNFEPLASGENQTFEYIIQPGDTLSEIAASNNTSIENIMELNPEIENPDLIYAGSPLTIPENDNISNPYQTTTDPLEAEIDTGNQDLITDAGILEGFDVPEDGTIDSEIQLTGEEYEQIDWIAYDDTPVNLESSEFYNEFEQTDFDSYSSTASYMDQSFYESGNQDTINNFI